MPETPEPLDDRAPADLVTVSFESIVDVFLDGVGSGAATAFAAAGPPAYADQAAQAIVERTKADPLAVEQLRDHIRKRLRGDVDNDTTEVSVWGDPE